MRLSPKAPWKLETDVRVEEEGAVFLVYPFTDFAREWLDKTKTYLGVAGGWAISCLSTLAVFLRLVARMVDGDLWVVWRG